MLDSMIKKQFLSLALLMMLPGLSQAMLITPAGASATPFVNNSPGLIIDGFVPTEMTHWQNPVNVWWTGEGPILTVDLGALYRVDDVLLSVDNNDQYLIESSTDGIAWNTLFTVEVLDGNVDPSPGGMDTMSTDITHAEYVANLDFMSVNAQFLRIQGLGPDMLYSVGELQAFGALVPVPAAVWLFGTALLGLFGFNRRNKTV
jgi:hypothetical protein